MADAVADPIDMLVLDRHRSYRQALALYLGHQAGYGRIIDAGSTEEATAAARLLTDHGGRHRPVILLNVVLEDADSLDLVPEMTLIQPRAAIVVLTGIDDPARLGRMVEAGAVAILSKRLSLEEIDEACRQAAEGRLHLEASVADELLRAASRERHERQRATSALASLSARERQILQMITEARSDREIAADLSISYETVRSHVANILRKLQVNSRTAAILFALRQSAVK